MSTKCGGKCVMPGVYYLKWGGVFPRNVGVYDWTSDMANQGCDSTPSAS